MPDTYSDGNFWALRTVITYEAVCLPENAHGYDGWGDLQTAEDTESVAHVLAGCTSLAQKKYFARHNAALKILFFETLQDLGLVDSVPPWYSPLKPKPVYEANNAQAASSRMSLYLRNTKKLEPTE